MGANQSVRSTQEINDASRTEKHQIRTMNGQKTRTAKSEVPQEEPMISAPKEEPLAVAADGNGVDFSEDVGVDEDSDLEEEEDDDDDDGKAVCCLFDWEDEWILWMERSSLTQEDFAIAFLEFATNSFDDPPEGLVERRMILDDARMLRQVAEFFYHPEKPVETDATACARCYFSRPSAPEQDSSEDEEARDLALADALKLKKLAVDYLYPELPVGSNTDGASFGRNYFGRPSAPDVQDEEDAEERERILKDMKQLKMAAEWYLQPEKPVVSDGCASGRNFFTRHSAPPLEGDLEERELVLAEALALKKVAEWYLNPEKPVEVDATASGRNFFARASAPDYEGEDEMDEQNLIIEELKHLKRTAEWYLQPEKPVAVDALTCSRNYFTRASAPEYEDDEVDGERDLVLAEAHELKKYAQWYLQPEKPVVVDAAASGRNYFSRGSAPEYDDEESDVDEERELILADAKKLKAVAKWYLQPETPIDSDGFATGRNYFSRPSAPEYDEDDMEERDLILKDMKQLKMTAEWYLNPEKPVMVDSCATGRGYFTRASAPDFEEEETAAERDLILSDASELKKVAGWYLHPEIAVQVDSTATGRDFFSRPSAPELEDDDSSERELVLADAKQLKKVAEWYLQPEKPVVSDDPFATGRNFFSRPSADHVGEDTDEEREQVLAEAKELKKVAEWYMEPEKAVINTDAFSMGRNFFTRPSAPAIEEELYQEERERILADAMELKKFAEWYLHPEAPVVVTDSCANGRNYFSRPSAPEFEDKETRQERERILMEAKELKQVAEWYHNPETPVTSSIAVTRNFFTRPSAEGALDEAEEEEKELILADAMRLKKLATDYLHPEKPVESSVNCVRNYFDRPSGKGHSDYIHSEGYAIQGHDYSARHLSEDQTAPHDYYNQYHHYSCGDDDDHSHHTQSDHFEMDEDVFHGFRESLYAVQEHMVPIIKECEDGEEGKLSRSPSTVMLFDEAM